MENYNEVIKSGGQYEEFTAEIDDNVLCVRMPKNAGIVQRVYDRNESPRKLGYSDNGRNVMLIN